MISIEELIEERDKSLAQARRLTEYINSDEFYATGVTDAERHYIKKQEKSLLEYHASLINQIEVKTNPT